MKKVYAPGCALMIYKPDLAEKVLKDINEEASNVNMHLTCCRHNPNIKEKTQIINTCAGCDRRYRELYEDVTTVSLWEILAESTTFNFPDYSGMKMAIHDACPTRTEARVHESIRKVLKKMNIDIIEPQNTRDRAVCCGDSLYGEIPIEKVKRFMTKRADSMPCDEVVVYCVSCIKAMHIGGKKPRYIIDLLYGEETTIGEYEPDKWHEQLQEFIDQH